MNALSPLSNALPLRLGTAGFLVLPQGALWWPDEAMLVVADLHLEKGSSFAARHGVLLPPYDTAATLKRLTALADALLPARIVALGDSFHDAEAALRLSPADRDVLAALTGRQDWFWIAGNHDPLPAPSLGGRCRIDEIVLGGIAFRHAATPGAGTPEISGHFHPKASLRVHGRRLSCRCFVSDGERLILPAFGAYTGGLDVRETPIRSLFPGGFTAHLVGTARITAVPGALLV